MRKREELETIVMNHKLWRNHEGGERVNLQYADLGKADLRNADLRNAYLQYADLRNADLQYADLRYAYLDYSCLPLWCGSMGMVVDRKIAAQIAAHFCALSCDDPDFQKARAAIIDFALTSHRADDLGLK